jgi:hypothetical protein
VQHFDPFEAGALELFSLLLLLLLLALPPPLLLLLLASLTAELITRPTTWPASLSASSRFISRRSPKSTDERKRPTKNASDVSVSRHNKDAFDLYFATRPHS